MAVSGKKSAVDFEALFARSNSRIKLPQGSWSRYLRGEITPQGARNEDVLSLVKRMDARFPGTADVFQHPLWRLLDFNEWLNPEDLKAMYVSLHEMDSSEFIDPKCYVPVDVLVHHFHFWRPRYSTAERRVRLQRRSGISGISACLIEARMDYLGQDGESFLSCLRVACEHTQSLRGQYHSEKMMSPLLLIEAYCVAYALCYLYHTRHSGRTHEKLATGALKLWHEWQSRYNIYLERLPAKAEESFRNWAKEIIRLAD